MGLTFQQREGGGGRWKKGKHSAVPCQARGKESGMKRTGWGEDAPRCQAVPEWLLLAEIRTKS